MLKEKEIAFGFFCRILYTVPSFLREIDTRYLRGYPTLATYKAYTGYPTMATPTMVPIEGDTGYL
jgi:hypothetical protein